MHSVSTTAVSALTIAESVATHVVAAVSCGFGPVDVGAGCACHATTDPVTAVATTPVAMAGAFAAVTAIQIPGLGAAVQLTADKGDEAAGDNANCFSFARQSRSMACDFQGRNGSSIIRLFSLCWTRLFRVFCNCVRASER